MITPSGGLVYHARALRGVDRWFPTRCLVSHWLRNWLNTCAPEHLVLIGPSAGYLLDRDLFTVPPLPFLRRLTIVEPDRLGQVLFSLRHASPRNLELRRIASSEVLPHISQRESDFAEFVGQVSGGIKTAICFAGVLGQLEFHRNRFRREEQLAQQLLLRPLQKLPWASLHDLESKVLSKASARNLTQFLEANPDHAIPKAVQANQAMRIEWIESHLDQGVQLPANWTDHATEWIGAPQVAGLWRLTERQLHVLGFTSNNLSTI